MSKVRKQGKYQGKYQGENQRDFPTTEQFQAELERERYKRRYRSTVVGCVADEQIVGKIVFRVWPFGGFGTVQ